MFGLGLPEIGIIAVVALLIFGPKKIPEMGSAIGKTLKGFKDEMSKTQEEAEEQGSGGAEEQGGQRSRGEIEFTCYLFFFSFLAFCLSAFCLF